MRYEQLCARNVYQSVAKASFLTENRCLKYLHYQRVMWRTFAGKNHFRAEQKAG